MDAKTAGRAAAYAAALGREARWQAALAVGAALILNLTLSEKLTLGPSWLAPALMAILLVPLIGTLHLQELRLTRARRIASIALIGIINAANFVSLGLLVDQLLRGSKATAHDLIFEAIKIWLTNVIVFGLWYWEFDRGGPEARNGADPPFPDFLFPQMTVAGVAPPAWIPAFVDYLYLAFTNATAFSPTDTLPLTPWAKLLMLLQALASLLTVALVAARAVNLLS